MIDFFSRLDSFLKYKGLNDNKITVETGISNGLIGKGRKRGALSQESISKILCTYKELDANWLLTGKGEMLRASGEVPAIAEQSMSGQGIPLYDVSVSAGGGTFEEMIAENKVIGTYNIPNFKRVDWMIYVKGSSMYPKYSSGDIIACRELHESRFIQWGKVYVVATREQGLLIKRIEEHDDNDTLLLISDNPAYKPFKVPKEEICGIAIVVGVIRLE